MQEEISEAARLMGRIKTEKKAAAARKNGTDGGGRKPGTPMTEETKEKIRATWRKKRKVQEVDNETNI